MPSLSALSQAVLAFVAAHQYGGLFLLLLIEEAGVPLPLPGDTLVMYAGLRSLTGQANAALIILVATVAVMLGSSALYWLARRGGRPALLRYGRFLHLHPERVDRMQRRFLRWGPWAIIFGRLIPGLRTPTSVMAGLFQVPYRVFLPCNALSALLWALFYFYVGALLAPAWREALTFVQGDIDAAVGIAVGVGAAALAGAVLWRRRAARGAHRAVGSASTGSEGRPALGHGED